MKKLLMLALLTLSAPIAHADTTYYTLSCEADLLHKGDAVPCPTPSLFESSEACEAAKLKAPSVEHASYSCKKLTVK